jgi:broad specificity phosphatase PhoE
MIEVRSVKLGINRHRLCRVKSTSGAPLTSSWHDEYSHLNDRIDAPPPPFPSLKSNSTIRFTIVRHGQSTWNAINRIQGSSDLSELTEKGKAQAESSRQMLEDMEFDLVFASPLRRARQTADIIVRGRMSLPRHVPRHNLMILREIDLYSFQGLIKQEVKEKFPLLHRNWKNHPDLFEIDSHAPCREMWHRGGLAWCRMIKIIEDGHEGEARDLSVLVVAHNNTNQALISSALGLDCKYFRRLVQSNAAMSSLIVRTGPSQQQTIQLEFLNQSPYKGSSILSQDDKVAQIIVLVATSDAGHIEKIKRLLSGEAKKEMSVFVDQTCNEALLMCQQGMLPLSPSLPLPSDQPWPHLRAHSSQTSATIVLASSSTASSIICQALDIVVSPEQSSIFQMTPGGLSILEIEDRNKAIAHCLNTTSHLK